MSVAGNQQRTFLGLVAQLRPHWHRERNLPARIQSLLAANRSFGSRDRRLYRELIYTALRYLPWIEPSLDRDAHLATRLVAWLAADTPATQKFRADVTADWPSCPVTLAEKSLLLATTLAAPQGITYEPGELLPAWFRDHCPDAFEPRHLDALLARAPLWLRLQTHHVARVTDEFAQLGWRSQSSPLLAYALRVLDEADVTKSSAYQSGLVEIQDLGSQLLLESIGVTPGGHWLDACAGAGGKTLQLSRLLGPTGLVDAHDVRPAALDELVVRARRAGVPVSVASDPRPNSGPTRKGEGLAGRSDDFAPIRVVTTPAPAYDAVLVDAPCSGSGTWRRAPHLKWTTTPAQIEEAAALQGTLLTQFSHHVRPGGRLIYATCSLSRRENEDVAGRFLASDPAFSIESPVRDFGASHRTHGLLFLPALHHTDGFFIASFRRAH